jgi:hypothetical protein
MFKAIAFAEPALRALPGFEDEPPQSAARGDRAAGARARG